MGPTEREKRSAISTKNGPDKSCSTVCSTDVFRPAPRANDFGFSPSSAIAETMIGPLRASGAMQVAATANHGGTSFKARLCSLCAATQAAPAINGSECFKRVTQGFRSGDGRQFLKAGQRQLSRKARAAGSSCVCCQTQKHRKCLLLTMREIGRAAARGRSSRSNGTRTFWRRARPGTNKSITT